MATHNPCRRRCALPALCVLLAVLLCGCGVWQLLETRQSLYEKAAYAYEEGSCEQAARLTQQALKKSGDVPDDEIYRIQGAAYADMGDAEAAFASYELALQANPHNEIVLSNMGVLHRQEGNYTQAAAYYRQAIAANPQYPEAHANLGVLCVLENNASEAIVHLKEAIRLDPSLPNSYASYAVALAMQGHFDEAEEQLAKAIVHGYQNAEDIRQRIDALR